ncbi:MAG TPA: hypothetical protein VFQ40_08615 [Actinomycetota bacterium]|nr:hypothetical protein [Actinomycetota bacterium]
MRWLRLCAAVLALAAACTRPEAPRDPSVGPTPGEEPSVAPSGPRLPSGSALPPGCLGGVGSSHTAAFVADGRAWAVDPADGDVACLFPLDGDAGPFVWGPQGDRVLLGGFEVLGITPEAPDLPPIDVRVGAFDWGHPIGLAIVFADGAGRPRKRFVDDGRVERLRSLPEGRYLEVAYHPSGLALAFVVQGLDGQEIWLSTNEGEAPERLIFAEAGTTFPSIAFSPNGSQLWWTARHEDGSAQLHRMDLAERTGFETSWRVETEATAEDLRIAPGGRLKSLNLGTGCEDRQAIVVTGRTGRPALPGEAGPTSAVGWLDATTLLVAVGGCDGVQDLYAIDALGDEDPVALVLGVELAAPRTVVRHPPRSVPVPPAEEEPPPGGVG